MASSPLDFELSYAGVPFVVDHAKTVRLKIDLGEARSDQSQILKQQPLPNLIDEINKMWPLEYLQDFTLPPTYLGKNLGALAYPWPANHQPNPKIKIGDWYYPTNASRWSVFRYLATSSQTKEMEKLAMGKGPKTFKIKAVPVSPTNPAQTDFEVSTNMYMLPPRTIGEGTDMDGLFLITLVDERFYFQGTPAVVRVEESTTWAGLISQLAGNLGITVTSPTIPAAYNTPEPDSQFWSNMEYAAFLLDAVAFNLGMVVVRGLDGTYTFKSAADSSTQVTTNRGASNRVVRLAGGNIFNPPGTQLPVGDLTLSRNAVCPKTVYVNYPKYIFGNDPVPHFFNDRYANPRPTGWFEDSVGGTFTIAVPIASGSRTYLSGVSGVGDHTIHTTAKAYYATESVASSGLDPLNVSGLTSLAMQIANDFWNQQVAVALDEVYPGIVEWTPEGIHDIIWSYSANQRQASTRVMRTEWNQVIRQMQHAAGPLSGVHSPPGVGGHVVSQTWRDSITSGFGPSTTIVGDVTSVGSTLTLLNSWGFPRHNRWIANLDNETILMEGTSGGTSLTMAMRGFSNTVIGAHSSGATIYQLFPTQVGGVNLVTLGSGLELIPGVQTSGGIQEVVLGPSTFQAKVTNVGDSNGHSYVEVRPDAAGAYSVVSPGRVGAAQYTKNGDLTTNNQTVTNILDTAGLYSGQLVTHISSGGMGLASGTYLTEVGSGYVILSKNAVTGGLGQVLRFHAMYPAYECNVRPQPVDTIITLRPSYRSSSAIEYQFDQDTETFWAQITSRSLTAFAWTEVVESSPGSFSAGGKNRAGYVGDTRLSAAIGSATATSITVEDGSVLPQTTGRTYVITVDSEQMLVTAGQGTAALTVERGWNQTTAATHSQYATVLWRENAAYDANLLTKDVPPTQVVTVGTYVLMSQGFASPGINNRIVPGLSHGPIWTFYWVDTPITATISASATGAGGSTLRNTITATDVTMELEGMTSVFPWEGPKFFVQIDDEVVTVTDPTGGTTGQLDATVTAATTAASFTWVGTIPGYPFYAKVAKEIVLVTGAGAITRGQFTTTAVPHGIGTYATPLSRWTITRAAQDTLAAAHTAAATITQVKPPYAWSQAQETVNGQLNGGGPLTGTMAVNPAYEINNNWLVSGGTNVRLWRAYDDVGLHGREWLFEYCCKGNTNSTRTIEYTTLSGGYYSGYTMPNADIWVIKSRSGGIYFENWRRTASNRVQIEVVNDSDYVGGGGDFNTAADTISMLPNGAAAGGANAFQTPDNYPVTQQPKETTKWKLTSGYWKPAEKVPGPPYSNTSTTTGGGTTGFSLSSGVVQSGHLGAYSVNDVNINSGAVTTSTMASGAVTSNIVASGAIRWWHLGSGAVSSGHLAPYSVNDTNINSGAVTNATIASGAVQWQHLGSGAIRSGHLTSGAFILTAGDGVSVTPTSANNYTVAATSGVCTPIGAKISYAPLSGSAQSIAAGVSGTLVNMTYVEWNSGMTTSTASKIKVVSSGKYITIINLKACWASGAIQSSGSFVSFSLVKE